MKKLLLATTILATALTSAHADVKEYYSSGYWHNYWGRGDTGTLVCGMDVNGRDAKGVHIKWWGTRNYEIQIFKADWRIPEGTKISVEIGFDRNSWGKVSNGLGTTTSGKGWKAGMVTVGFDSSVVDDFLENVAHADKMWIKFADGSEPDWVIPMEGSRNSVNAFKDCVAKLAPTQTQPFDNSNSTQPFSKDRKKAGEESF